MIRVGARVRGVGRIVRMRTVRREKEGMRRVRARTRSGMRTKRLALRRELLEKEVLLNSGVKSSL